MCGDLLRRAGAPIAMALPKLSEVGRIGYMTAVMPI